MHFHLSVSKSAPSAAAASATATTTATSAATTGRPRCATAARRTLHLLHRPLARIAAADLGAGTPIADAGHRVIARRSCAVLRAAAVEGLRLSASRIPIHVLRLSARVAVHVLRTAAIEVPRLLVEVAAIGVAQGSTVGADATVLQRLLGARAIGILAAVLVAIDLL
jgi:hypothetical protein